MVLGFFIQSLHSNSDIAPALCYWEPFDFVAKKPQNDGAETNTNEKQALSFILTRVQTEFSFRKEVAITNRNIDEQDEEATKNKTETGIFRIRGYREIYVYIYVYIKYIHIC